MYWVPIGYLSRKGLRNVMKKKWLLAVSSTCGFVDFTTITLFFTDYRNLQSNNDWHNSCRIHRIINMAIFLFCFHWANLISCQWTRSLCLLNYISSQLTFDTNIILINKCLFERKLTLDMGSYKIYAMMWIERYSSLTMVFFGHTFKQPSFTHWGHVLAAGHSLNGYTRWQKSAFVRLFSNICLNVHSDASASFLLKDVIKYIRNKSLNSIDNNCMIDIPLIMNA